MRKASGTAGEKAEAAIRNVFEAGCAAWNRADLDGYLASYWDSDQTRWVSGGSLARGKKAIAAAYKARFSGSQQLGQLTVTDLEIEVLTGTEAIAFGRWTLVVNNETSTGFFTVQLRNIDGTWLFVSDHASA